VLYTYACIMLKQYIVQSNMEISCTVPNCVLIMKATKCNKLIYCVIEYMPSDIIWVWIDKWYRSHKLLLHKTSLTRVLVILYKTNV